MRPDDIRELFEPTGPVSIRRMFGGHGIFRDGLMIAIAADDALWLKTDAECRNMFESAGSRPFSFPKSDGSVTVLSYWSLPDEALDDPDAMRHWVHLAESAARRASLAAGSRKSRAKR